jgi:hypothetical protein
MTQQVLIIGIVYECSLSLPLSSSREGHIGGN